MSIITKEFRQKKTIIIGAGVAGQLVLDEIRRTLYQEIFVMGFVDDDLNKVNREFNDVMVLGTTYDLKDIIINYKPEMVLIAIPSASGKTIERINEELRGFDLDVRIVPGIFELIEQRSVIGSPVRAIKYSDIFMRKPRSINIEKIKNSIQNKNILVTGGAGSIGSEIVRALIKLRANSVLVLDINENSMMNLLVSVNEIENKDSIIPIIADITDKKTIEDIFKKYPIDYIYHAAAKKHVYFMELYPFEAIKTNIIGTNNLLEVSKNYPIEKFIMISTDKAVNPTSVMGATKRLCELLISEYNIKYNLKASSVRFGNVFNSAGSVIPIFKQQIENGGPITVTHPEIERYFMTISEASRLVIQASVFDTVNQVFVLDMKEQIKIMDIAKKMIKFYDMEDQIEIEITKLKPGEKLYEELYYDHEDKSQTSNDSIFSVSSTYRWETYEEDINNFRENYNDNNILYNLLKERIPTFTPSNLLKNTENEGT